MSKRFWGHHNFFQIFTINIWFKIANIPNTLQTMLNKILFDKNFR